MYQSKFRKKKHLSKRSVVLLTSLVLLLGIAAGATAAYIFTNSAQVTNTFIPAEVKCEVREAFDYTTKSNVQIENTGNVDAYIRAMVFVNWVDKSNNKIVPAPAGYTHTGYNINSKWVQHTDGYYYYTEKVPSLQLTESIIDSIAPNGVSNPQYYLKVDIIADAIQADPINAVVNSWGIDPESLAPSGT